jgi:AmmeMemoRadiSam system protein A
MSSCEQLDEAERARALQIVRASIAYGLTHGVALPIDEEGLGDRMTRPGAAFVTLHLDGQLRGCVGNLRARGRLADELSRAAFSAAFRDPRFGPVTPDELERLEIHISVLSAPVPLTFQSEADVIAQLRPAIDGLILTDQGRLGTFLPDVWASIPDPKEFLAQLRLKAGLSPNHWSPTLAIERYTTQSFQ